jgi:hypothetical protein
MRVKGHYVNEYKTLDFLGYEVKEINPSEHTDFDGDIGEIFDDTCAVLYPKKNLVLLSSKISNNRKRLTLFHEAGHEILPYHQNNYFSIRGNDIDALLYKKMEREAFLAGTELMFPLKHFIDDAMGLHVSFGSIKKIADKYKASFEATCIRYAITSREIVAIAVIKENDLLDQVPASKITSRQGKLFSLPPIVKKKPALNAPLRVQYCTSSHRFHKFIKSGTLIWKDNIIYQSWFQKKPIQGEITTSTFGSFDKFNYSAECLPYYDRVFVLLSLTNKQRFLL